MEITEKMVSGKLPVRPKNANKGTFGKALIIAGSKNYPGAAILSCLACARVGAGLITLATEKPVYDVAVPKIPFATFLDFSEVAENISKYDSVLIGCGLGQSEETKNLFKEFISWDMRSKKIIIDADGLNILSGVEDWSKILEMDLILTPHPGEMARLTELDVEEIQSNRDEVAKKYSKLWKKTIVLKGSETIIANPKGEIYKSEFKNPLLATAGTGDVLSGIIAGLLAQGLNLTDASIVSVYIHGKTAEDLKQKFGDSGMNALDLAEAIPQTIKNMKSV